MNRIWEQEELWARNHPLVPRMIFLSPDKRKFDFDLVKHHLIKFPEWMRPYFIFGEDTL